MKPLGFSTWTHARRAAIQSAALRVIADPYEAEDVKRDARRELEAGDLHEAEEAFQRLTPAQLGAITNAIRLVKTALESGQDHQEPEARRIGDSVA